MRNLSGTIGILCGEGRGRACCDRSRNDQAPITDGSTIGCAHGPGGARGGKWLHGDEGVTDSSVIGYRSALERRNRAAPPATGGVSVAGWGHLVPCGVTEHGSRTATEGGIGSGTERE